MTPTPRRLVPAFAAVALLAVLTACGGGTPGPTGAPSIDPAPDETVVAAAPGSRPETRTDATCADLVGGETLSTAFGTSLTLAGPERTAQYIGILADEWGVLQAGGLACEWLSADSIVASEGQFNYQGVRVFLLPADAALWEPYSLAEAGGTDRAVACYDSSCTLNQYFDAGWWLSITATDTAVGFADAATATAPIFDTVAGIVATLAAPSTPWTPPTPGVALPSSCEGIITGDQVAATLGVPGPAIAESPTYPSIYDAIETASGGNWCRWVGADAFTDLVSIEWLPGGAWAMQGNADAAEAMSGTAVPTVAVPGVDDPAYVREHVDFVSLSVDLGDNWIVLTGAAGAVGSTQASLVALASQIAANFD